MRSLVISVQLYACESWTVISDILKKLQATEIRCSRKLLGISYRDHITKPSGPMMTWRYGHESRSAGLTKTILQGRERADKRSVGRITSLSGQGWSFATPKENVKTNSHGGKGLIGPWRPSGHHDYRIGEGASFLLTSQTNQHLFITQTLTKWGNNI